MKETVSKIDAAKRQLVTAIDLLFREKDTVSRHTLACAALNILHDHIPESEAWKYDLLFHYESIWIKDEGRKIWAHKVREAANFFKHADQDIKNGKIEIEFDSSMTNFYILESLNCLRIIQKDQIDWPPEFSVFTGWFFLKNPTLLKKGAEDSFPAEFFSYSPDDMKFFLTAIDLMKNVSRYPAKHYRIPIR